MPEDYPGPHDAEVGQRYLREIEGESRIITIISKQKTEDGAISISFQYGGSN